MENRAFVILHVSKKTNRVVAAFTNHAFDLPLAITSAQSELTRRGDDHILYAVGFDIQDVTRFVVNFLTGKE